MASIEQSVGSIGGWRGPSIAAHIHIVEGIVQVKACCIRGSMRCVRDRGLFSIDGHVADVRHSNDVQCRQTTDTSEGWQYVHTSRQVFDCFP